MEHENPESYRFCSNCGAVRSDADEPAKRTSSRAVDVEPGWKKLRKLLLEPSYQSPAEAPVEAPAKAPTVPPAIVNGERTSLPVRGARFGGRLLMWAVLAVLLVVTVVIVAAVMEAGGEPAGVVPTSTPRAIAPEAQSSLSLKGLVVAEAAGPNSVDVIKFKLANASGAEGVDLAGATTLVVYTDKNQSVNATFDALAWERGFLCGNFVLASEYTGNVCWSHSWVVGGGPTIDGGEVVEFEVWLDEMGNDLNANQLFKIEVIPGKGAVIPISRKTPLELSAVMSLD